ncbi:unnamed protein product [Prunus brigantina]
MSLRFGCPFLATTIERHVVGGVKAATQLFSNLRVKQGLKSEKLGLLFYCCHCI